MYHDEKEKRPKSLLVHYDGQIVHYVACNGRALPAIVIGHEVTPQGDGKSDLVVFTSMPNVNGVKNFGHQFHQDVEYGEGAIPGTYHFIEPESTDEAKYIMRRMMIDELFKPEMRKMVAEEVKAYVNTSLRAGVPKTE